MDRSVNRFGTKNRLFVSLGLALSLAACSSAPETIHQAAKMGDLQAVQKFLDQDPNLAKSTASPKGRTPLHMAKTAAIAELLISKGADVNAPDQFAYTPLHTAMSGETAEALIKHGADVFKEANDHMLPIYTCQAVDVVPVLIAHGARVNEALPNQPYKTPLWFAIYEDRKDVANALLQNGAMATISDRDGETYLHLAAKKDNAEIAEALIKGGADVNATDQNGETPLIGAVVANALKSAEILLEHKADTTRTLAAGVSFMSFSSNGPNTTKNAGGMNAMQLAESTEMKTLLQKYGAQ